MSIKTDISVGDFLDKLIILEIKRSKISDQTKLININKEYESLMNRWENSQFAGTEISQELAALKEVNEVLWDIEDKIRDKEANKEFDKTFIELARAVYITNDERARIKRRLNEKLSSDFQEEKSYKEY